MLESSRYNFKQVEGKWQSYWDKNKSLVYRDSISLRGGANLKTEQAMDMIALALDAAERGYPACQYVIWAGKSPEYALTSALVDLESNK